ncbi:MAG: hypothetical protein IPO41_00975 [Acidobacteria bacterium]|nr:hypothetical protein [Acidobacteriota bacterium]
MSCISVLGEHFGGGIENPCITRRTLDDTFYGSQETGVRADPTRFLCLIEKCRDSCLARKQETGIVGLVPAIKLRLGYCG